MALWISVVVPVSLRFCCHPRTGNIFCLSSVPLIYLFVRDSTHPHTVVLKVHNELLPRGHFCSMSGGQGPVDNQTVLISVCNKWITCFKHFDCPHSSSLRAKSSCSSLTYVRCTRRCSARSIFDDPPAVQQMQHRAVQGPSCALWRLSLEGNCWKRSIM